MLLFMLCLSTGARAQMRSPKSLQVLIGGGGGTAVGFNYIRLDKLSAVLKQNGYEGFNNLCFSFGANLNFIFRKLIMTSEIRKFPFVLQNKEGYLSKLDVNYGLFNAGILLYSKGRFTLYPMFGIGDGTFSLRLYEKDPAAKPTFDNVYTEKKGVTVKNYNSSLLSFVLGSNYTVASRMKFFNGWNFGLEAGYIRSVKHSDWFIDDIIFRNSPETSLTGVYCHLLLGRYLF